MYIATQLHFTQPNTSPCLCLVVTKPYVDVNTLFCSSFIAHYSTKWPMMSKPLGLHEGIWLLLFVTPSRRNQLDKAITPGPTPNTDSHDYMWTTPQRLYAVLDGTIKAFEAMQVMSSNCPHLAYIFLYFLSVGQNC
jgi:hypothetical protein